MRKVTLVLSAVILFVGADRSDAFELKLDGLAGRLKRFAEKSDGQIRGLKHDAEATQTRLEFLSKKVDSKGRKVSSLEKKLESFAKKTDGQLRGLAHDLEALEQQIFNQARRRKRAARE